MEYEELIKILDSKRISYIADRSVVFSFVGGAEVVMIIKCDIKTDLYIVRTYVNTNDLDIVISKNNKNELISEFITRIINS